MTTWRGNRSTCLRSMHTHSRPIPRLAAGQQGGSKQQRGGKAGDKLVVIRHVPLLPVRASSSALMSACSLCSVACSGCERVHMHVHVCVWGG